MISLFPDDPVYPNIHLRVKQLIISEQIKQENWVNPNDFKDDREDDRPKILVFLFDSQKISLGVLIKDVTDTCSVQSVVWPWPSHGPLFC